MPPIVTIRAVTIGFRGPSLLDNVSGTIDAGQRIGLLGRNGAGKTTFMKLLSGEIEPDHGEIIRSPGVTVALLPQDVPHNLHGTIAEVVSQGLPDDHREPDAIWKGERQV